MGILKNMREWMEKWSVAAAYGEANDAVSAREIVGAPEPKALAKTVEDWMTAAAFAEANEPEAAREIIGAEEPLESYLERKLGAVVMFGVAAIEGEGNGLDIPGVKVWFGTAEVA